MCLCQIRPPRPNKDHKDQATFYVGYKRAQKRKVCYAFARSAVESRGALCQLSHSALLSNNNKRRELI